MLRRLLLILVVAVGLAGHSLVIDPWGEILLDMGEEKGVGFADIDLKRISDVRSRIPALNHRRPIPDAVTL